MAHRYSKRNEARESTRTNGDQGDVSPGIRTGRRENEENPNAMVYHKVSHEYKMPDPPPLHHYHHHHHVTPPPNPIVVIIIRGTGKHKASRCDHSAFKRDTEI